MDDLVDRFFHRRLAAPWVSLLAGTRVRADHVTWARLPVGLLGSAFLFVGLFVPPLGPTVFLLLAALCLFVSMVMDCVDGQLARARDEATQVGRILDGLVDLVVFAPAYALLAAGVWVYFGAGWALVTVLAAFSMWGHSFVYDKVKRVYTGLVTEQEHAVLDDEVRRAVDAERAEAAVSGSALARFLLGVYANYLRVQARIAPGPERALRFRDEDGLGWFVSRHRSTVFLTGLLGLGTHVAVLYVGVAFMAVDLGALLVVQLLFLTAFNAIAGVVLWRVRGFPRDVEGPGVKPDRSHKQPERAVFRAPQR